MKFAMVAALFCGSLTGAVPFGISQVEDVEVFLIRMDGPPPEVLNKLFPASSSPIELAQHQGVVVHVDAPAFRGPYAATARISIVVSRPDGTTGYAEASIRYNPKENRPNSVSIPIGPVHEVVHLNVKIERDTNFGSVAITSQKR